MSDLKLFKLTSDHVTELTVSSMALEKSLQTLIEKHLDTFLGVTFLASEYSTGPKTGGRMDTLGIDENGAPVIIEYKKATNANVINQGLFYLDWLLDHRGDFELLVTKKIGADKATNIDWSSPRLLCIAGDFSKYDLHAVGQMQRNIELIRYAKYGDDLLALDLINRTSAPTTGNGGAGGGSGTGGGGVVIPKAGSYKTVSEYLAQADTELKDRFEALKTMILEMGEVEMKTLKLYFAFRRLKNFACVEVHTQTRKLLVFVKHPDPASAAEKGFARDVTTIGHFGTGNLELTLTSKADVEKARHLIELSYEAN
jgi:predicted transport protein